MKAVVVFTDRTGDSHPLSRLLRRGFRHCFVVVETMSGNWILVDGAAGVPYISIIGTADFDPEQFYADMGYTAVTTVQEDTAPRYPMAVANCVGMVKAILAIEAPLTHTPYALYRLLSRRARKAS